MICSLKIQLDSSVKVKINKTVPTLCENQSPFEKSFDQDSKIYQNDFSIPGNYRYCFLNLCLAGLLRVLHAAVRLSLLRHTGQPVLEGERWTDYGKNLTDCY